LTVEDSVVTGSDTIVNSVPSQITHGARRNLGGAMAKLLALEVKYWVWDCLRGENL